jgi:hypothetical protein
MYLGVLKLVTVGVNQILNDPTNEKSKGICSFFQCGMLVFIIFAVERLQPYSVPVLNRLESALAQGAGLGALVAGLDNIVKIDWLPLVLWLIGWVLVVGTAVWRTEEVLDDDNGEANENSRLRKKEKKKPSKPMWEKKAKKPATTRDSMALGENASVQATLEGTDAKKLVI